MLPEPIKVPGFHSKKSPSTAHRWVRCLGSVEEEEGLPDQVGEDALQGTVFHDYAADCLELGLEPWGLIGDRFLSEDGQTREFTREMASKMIPGLDMFWAMADVPGAEMFVERRVNLENRIGPGESGTSDVFIIDTLSWRLVTGDWKWGAGVPVSPEENEQAMLYTGGVWDTFAEDRFRDAYEGSPGPKPSWEEARDSIEVVIIIEQPRAAGGGGIWKTTLKEVNRLLKKVKIAADKAELPGQPRTPGEKQCKFCKAARHNTCTARAQHVMDSIGADLDSMADDLAMGQPLELTDRRSLSPEQRSQILLHQKLVTDFLKQLHEEAMDDAKAGRPVPGMKRVPGRNPARAWSDEDKAEIVLEHDFKEDAYTKKLRSPAQVEEEVGKAKYKQRYEGFVAQSDAKPILVPETDPRAALVSDDDLLDEMSEDNTEDSENLI